MNSIVYIRIYSLYWGFPRIWLHTLGYTARDVHVEYQKLIF